MIQPESANCGFRQNTDSWVTFPVEAMRRRKQLTFLEEDGYVHWTIGESIEENTDENRLKMETLPK